MQKRIIEWLANGETGVSSKTMAFVVGFNVIPNRTGYPSDPSDLRRCLQLLEIAPELRQSLDKLTPISPVWAEIVKNWDALEASYRTEEQQNKMPNTYALLQQFAEKDSKRIKIGNGVHIITGQ
ncbi:hypothetical protein A1D29_10450 [Pasteurellaceae bacterium Orientalotternb1]|nr:hypothetical protein A1D29_10450 [Pasteurellaceae bacterium Orientalotternb1]